MSENAGKLGTEASGVLDFPTDICTDLANPPETSTREFSLDAEPYSLATNTLAIGVRLTCSISVPSAEGEETHAALLIREGDALHQVLWLVLSRGSLDRVSRVETSEETAFSLLPSVHSGYRDVSTRTTISRRTVPLDASPDRTPSVTKRTRVFVWDGSRYLVQK
jgi:hypothetical protein